MLIVVFWLGATIYTSYYPDILIPIFNDFLPIHLVDASFIEITGLPLFAIPILILLGYWITVSVAKSHEKKMLMPSKTVTQKELKKEMKNYALKLKKWVTEGD